MKDARLVLGSLAFVAIVTVALAKDVENPHWLSKDEIKAIVAGEPPPPASGSDAEKADIQAEVAAQNSRDAARIAEAKRDEGYSVALFTDVIGPKITPQSNPQTFLFFDKVNKQIAKVVGESKEHWHRLRPYQAHPDVIHPIFQAGGYSYPSGHSTHSYAFAVVLGYLFPNKAAAFLDRAHQIAQSRVDAGVHYTSDIREGEVVGKEIAKELRANPEFRQELDAAKTELAAQK
jgi:acid phosphatase (class A)